MSLPVCGGDSCHDNSRLHYSTEVTRDTLRPSQWVSEDAHITVRVFRKVDEREIRRVPHISESKPTDPDPRMVFPIS